MDKQLACLHGENISSESQEELVGLAKGFRIVLTHGGQEWGLEGWSTAQLARQKELGESSRLSPRTHPNWESLQGGRRSRGEPTRPSRA